MARQKQPTNNDKRVSRDQKADREAVISTLKLIEEEGISQRAALERSGVPMHVFYGHKKAMKSEAEATSTKKRTSKKSHNQSRTRSTRNQKVLPTSVPRENQIFRQMVEREKERLRGDAIIQAERELAEELNGS